jgi:hypothetical protein
MSRRGTIAILVLLGLVASVVAAFAFLPRKYQLGERLGYSAVFWHNDEAFLFLDVNITGRATNVIQDKLAHTRTAYLALLAGGSRVYGNEIRAYRLTADGQIVPESLPVSSSFPHDWTLSDGNLQLTTSRMDSKVPQVVRWDGSKFADVSSQAEPLTPAAEDNTLRSDDVADDDAYSDFLKAPARSAFKAAGWHWKEIGFNETKDLVAVLPIKLGNSSLDLRVTSFPPPDSDQLFDILNTLNFGVRSYEIAPSGQPNASHVLWSQNGWKTISRAEFEQWARQSGPSVALPVTIWIWIAALLLLYLWKLGGWAKLFINRFGTKRRMLANLGTSYSFPAAIPAQFPLLDVDALDRYTRDLEGLGFVRLSDITRVSNGAVPVPNFCRIFAHKQNHCFAEVNQLFPSGKAVWPVKCAILGILDDNWSVTFSDREPRATVAVLRRKRAVIVAMPSATPYELLNSLLQMRSQICQDLGISFPKDDTLEAFMAKAQSALSDIRDTVKEKNMAAAIPQVYWNKFALLKTKREYVWLGAYPEIAESRKHGLVMRPRPL